MSEKPILLDVQDRIATTTLNRHERKNAINANMVNEWVEILDECRDNDDISAVIEGYPPGPGSKCCFSGAKCIG